MQNRTVLHLRPNAAPRGHRTPATIYFESLLLQHDLIAPSELDWELRRARKMGVTLSSLLLADPRYDRARVLALLCQSKQMQQCPPDPLQVDPELLDLISPQICLRHLYVPLLGEGPQTQIATANPEDFDALRPELEHRFGPIKALYATPAQIEAAVAHNSTDLLRQRAEERLDPAFSLRGRTSKAFGIALGLGGISVAAFLLWPSLMWGLVTAWLALTLAASSLLRALGLISTLAPKRRDQPPPPERLPHISILVPLYNEPEIAPRLVARLERLDYPRALLEVIILLEAKDQTTQVALGQSQLPDWMRVLVVPDGAVTTKPRAMNYGLDFCRGTIIGIYDAEDAPEPDQLRLVAARFAAAGPRLACLQGSLDYYNPSTNLLSRLFTAEYAAWFRVVMPALQHLRWPMPLGGTTLFVRRSTIESLGGWDAHNVTEDAELGIRLARAGLRTEMLPTTTYEEATCHLRPWVKQRSRWIKGHLLTWSVHMRSPRALWRDLGAHGFLGYQVVFLGAQSQVLMAPFLWSYWLLLLGLPHPARPLLEGYQLIWPLCALYITGELLLMGVMAMGLARTRHSRLIPVVLLAPLYHPLGAIAGWRGAIEGLRNPFHWAKTSHGHYEAPEWAEASKTGPP